MLALEQLGVERLRPGPEPGDCHDLARLGMVDQDRRDAGAIDEVALHDAERDAGGDPGIDRIAASLQDVEPGRRGQIMPGGDGVARDGDRRPMRDLVGCGHGVSFPSGFPRA